MGFALSSPAQMLQMQEELSRLRKKVTEDKKQPQPRTAPRSSGGGKRVAHQQHSAGMSQPCYVWKSSLAKLIYKTTVGQLLIVRMV